MNENSQNKLGWEGASNFSDAGLEFLSTSYAGAPREPSLRDEPLGHGRNIRVKNSNHFMHPRKSDTPSNLVDFYGREFLTTSDVLIPRPETEQVVDTVLNLVGKPFLPGVKPSEAKLSEDITIVDVGTGSGCIAITLKLEIPEARVIATDISDDALKVARENAKNLGAQMDFLQSDLLDKVVDTPALIVANLPYVDKNWEWVDEKALSGEPALALYANDGGLELIYKLIDQVAERSIKHLVLEADPCQHELIVKYAQKKGLALRETRGFILYLSE